MSVQCCVLTVFLGVSGIAMPGSFVNCSPSRATTLPLQIVKQSLSDSSLSNSTMSARYSACLDSTLQPGRSYSYSVRYVAVIGDNGDFSSSVGLNTLNRKDSTRPPANGYTPPARPFEPTDLQALIYGQELLELQWSGVPNTTLYDLASVEYRYARPK